MKMKLKAVALVFLTFFTISTFVACEKEGNAEKAGKEIDKAFDSVKGKINDATK